MIIQKVDTREFFTELADTPATLEGQEGRFLVVGEGGQVVCGDLPSNINNDIAKLHGRIETLEAQVSLLMRERHNKEEQNNG